MRRFEPPNSNTKQNDGHEISAWYKDYVIGTVAIGNKAVNCESAIKSGTLHPYLIDRISPTYEALCFLMRTSNKWNTLPSSVFSEKYNRGLF